MTNYVYTTGVHNLSAPREVVPVALQFVKPKSVLDIGCGTGTWLKVFEENGISDYLGIDGGLVPADQLQISPSKFQTKDLSEPIDIGRRFDLILCLEVAEHLSSQFADTLVNTLTKHGDAILFSAAIPGQGGQGHLNEQWPEYWRKKFEAHGYYFHDLIRPRIWNNPAVESWYKQNIFLITKTRSDCYSMLSVVHPEVFSAINRNRQEYEESLKTGQQGLDVSTKIFVQALLFKIRNLMGLK